MVRTAATAVRVSGGKSAKAVRISAPSSSGLQSSKNSGSIGGNPAAHRETPAWQKPITNFFRKTEGAESTTTTLPTSSSSNENSIATEKENIPNTSSKSTYQEENGEITNSTPNKDTDGATNKLGEEWRPQTSAHSENQSESEDKSKNKSEGENKENENHNSNSHNDFQTRKTTRDEDDEDLVPTKKPRIDYRKLEAIEKFAS